LQDIVGLIEFAMNPAQQNDHQVVSKTQPAAAGWRIHMKTPLMLIAAVPLFCVSCVPFNYNATARIYRDRANIRNNLLITGQPRKRFQSVWGPPTRTYSRRFDIGSHGELSWNPFGGSGSFAARGGQTYDLWFYEKKAVTLVFNRDELVYWHWGADPPNEKMYETDKIN
jgi:hypothetical protein